MFQTFAFAYDVQGCTSVAGAGRIGATTPSMEINVFEREPNGVRYMDVSHKLLSSCLD